MPKKRPTRTPTKKPATTLTLEELLEFPLDFYAEDSNPKRMDSYFIIFLQGLEGTLENAAAVIAKQIIGDEATDALANLTDKQRWVLKTYILDEHVVTGFCELDGAEFTWEDQHSIVKSEAFGDEPTYWHENCLAHANGEDQP